MITKVKSGKSKILVSIYYWDLAVFGFIFYIILFGSPLAVNPDFYHENLKITVFAGLIFIIILSFIFKKYSITIEYPSKDLVLWNRSIFFFIRERKLSHGKYRLLTQKGFILDRLAYYKGHHAHLKFGKNEGIILDVSTDEDSICSLIKLLDEGPVAKRGSKKTSCLDLDKLPRSDG